MRKNLILGALLCASITSTAMAQTSDVTASVVPAVAEAVTVPEAMPAVVAAAPQELLLPADTPISMSLNEQLSSRTHEEGDTFSLTVVQDVMVDGQVVIPRGTRAMGQVTWKTGTGAFGKSGKMEISFRYLDFNGTRVPLRGMHRQEGEGNTAATVGAVLGAGVIGGLLVRGRRALIQQGREFTAYTVDAVPFTSGAAAGMSLASNYAPSAVSTALGQHGDD